MDPISDAKADLENAFWLYKQRIAQEKEAMHERLEYARIELSKVMHAADKAGVSKADIRAKVRAHSNNRVFNPLWNAWDPDAPDEADYVEEPEF